MLGKLLKYDLRASMRKFAPLWLAVLSMSVLTGLVLRATVNSGSDVGFIMKFLTVLMPFLLFALFIAVAVIFFVFVCQRFYHGLLGDEGYLSMTLPVTVEAHIASKGLSALILSLGTLLVTFLSMFLLLVLVIPVEDVKIGFEQLYRAYQDMPGWMLAELVLMLVIGSAAGISMLYAAISLGHLAKRHRVLWSVLAYIGLNSVLNSLFSFGMAGRLFNRFSLGVFEYSAVPESDIMTFVGEYWTACLIWALVYGTALFFLTRYILKKHLNLE